MSDIQTLLVLPHLRVQNANSISSPLTWGFPAMTAFVGLMHALERKLNAQNVPLLFDSIGVICHSYEAQASQGGYTRSFHLTRNPLVSTADRKKIAKDGTVTVPSFVEEGRIHLDISLVFAVRGDAIVASQPERDDLAGRIDDLLRGLRIAGGSVLPVQPGRSPRMRPRFEVLDDDADERRKQFKRVCRRWLPGFALVCRDDLLAERLNELRQTSPGATSLDAWLDLTRLNHECNVRNGEAREEITWDIRRRRRWLVPIPIGYGALSSLFESRTVANTRDATTPFRFVEGLYSVGEWVSPHRLERPQDLLWYVDNDLEAGLYRLNNDFHKRAA